MQTYNVQGTLVNGRQEAIEQSVRLWVTANGNNPKPFPSIGFKEVEQLENWVNEMLDKNHDNKEVSFDELVDALENMRSGFKDGRICRSDDVSDLLDM